MAKGLITISTIPRFFIEKSQPFDNFIIENILNDLKIAAEKSNFLDNDNNIMSFKHLKTKEEKHETLIKKIEFEMENFSGVNFSMSISENEDERKIFRAWNKFWIELTKIGYVIK